MLRQNASVEVYFGRLTGKTGTAPGSDIPGKVGPDITGGDEAASSPDSRVCQVVNVVKDSTAKGVGNKGAERTGGNITMKRNTKNLVLGMVEGTRMEELLSLGTETCCWAI